MCAQAAIWAQPQRDDAPRLIGGERDADPRFRQPGSEARCGEEDGAFCFIGDFGGRHDGPLMR